MKLNTSQVTFHPFSYGDWSGRVFSWEGGIYRAISSERAPFYEHLFSDGIFHDLMCRQLLVASEITDLELDGYALVLKHHTVPFASRCYEWCGEMLKAAALSVLKLERELLKYGLTLQDAHPYNVLFDGPMPIWVDLGSLVPACHGEPWHAYEEFLAYYTRPLKIMATGRGDIARCLLRCLLRPEDSGIQQRDVDAITGTAFTELIKIAKTRAKTAAKKIIPSMLRPLARHALRSVPRPPLFREMKEPTSTVDNAIHEVENIRLICPTARPNLYEDFPDFISTADWTEKHRSVVQILSTKKPGSVLDIGSGHGWYSQFAARNDAQIISVDFDELSVTNLFFDAVERKLPILPLVQDFRSLNPMMAWAAAPGVTPVDRFRCDMVLALALVHHLVFEQHLNFDLIVRGLSAFAQKHLVIEFIDCEDQYVRERLNGRFSWYNLENFLTAIRQEFHEVKKFPSNEEHRWVFLCEK